jgi:uncharacterized protein (DUF1330 family)
MKANYKLALTLLTGAALGAAAIQGLHAQAKPPVYIIGISEVTNQDGYSKEYLPKAQATIKAHGGVYVAAGPGTMIDGTLPKGRVVIVRWESMEALKGWHESPDYQAALKIGKDYAHYNVVAVDGVKQ